MKALLIAGAGAIASLLFCTNSAFAAPFTFDVVVNTSSLIANPAGPFSLDFQLNSGGGLVPNNTVTITNFLFGGGSGAPPAFTLNGASGDFASGITLTDSTAQFNELFETFNPGSFVRFTVSTTTNVVTPTPDIFSFAILDGSLFNIPTTDSVPDDSLVKLTINKTPLGLADVQAFRGENVPGGPNYSGVTATVVPEPMTLTLVGTGVAALVVRRRKRIA